MASNPQRLPIQQILANFSVTKILAGNGTAAAPSITFTNDSDSGLYWVSANVVGLTLAGTLRYTLASTGITAGAIGFIWNSGVADGASAIGHILNTTNALANAASKLASFQNNTTEKAYVDYLGNVAGLAFKCLTSATANSTGAGTILYRTASPTVNSAWLPFILSNGTTVYIPYWA